MKKAKSFFNIKYFITVFLVALLITGAIVWLANDAFAITAPNETAVISIPEGSSAKEVTKLLKDNGLIKSGLWFRTYLALRGKDISPKGDVYRIPMSSGFDGIHRILTYGSRAETSQVRISIPEGSSIDDIMRIICDENGICSRAEFIDTVQNGDFSRYSFLPSVKPVNAENGISADVPVLKRTTTDPASPKYRLEGYLYPDTYYFYSKSSAYSVIDKMLANFDAKFDEKYRLACKKQGLSISDAVTLASIIIKEAKFVSDYPKISSVFHNRLASSAFASRLQSDATVVYALGREMTPEDKSLDSPYNTYKYGGLPPSPIANPDLNAISYAIYPDRTPYFYFVTTKNGSALYASTYSAHLQNVRKAGLQ